MMVARRIARTLRALAAYLEAHADRRATLAEFRALGVRDPELHARLVAACGGGVAAAADLWLRVLAEPIEPPQPLLISAVQLADEIRVGRLLEQAFTKYSPRDIAQA
jgi:hypothetical protein